jgi:hypothetical protein
MQRVRERSFGQALPHTSEDAIHRAQRQALRERRVLWCLLVVIVLLLVAAYVLWTNPSKRLIVTVPIPNSVHPAQLVALADFVVARPIDPEHLHDSNSESYSALYGHRGQHYHSATRQHPAARAAERALLLAKAKVRDGLVVLDAPAGSGYVMQGQVLTSNNAASANSTSLTALYPRLLFINAEPYRRFAAGMRNTRQWRWRW